MSTLRFHLFGAARVARDGGEGLQEIPVRPAGWSLLAYLLLFRDRAHSRERLTDLFWRDQEERRARQCLRTTLWRLRRALKPDRCIVAGGEGQLRFDDGQHHWLDVAEFEEQTARGLSLPLAQMTPAEAKCLERARLLYVGDLLPDIYHDWALREQERLRLLHLKGLERLLHYYQDQRLYERALDCGQKILEQDPLREGIHQGMMSLYLANGQRAQAVEQYNRCEAALAEELHIAPMAKTQGLLAQALGTLARGTIARSDSIRDRPSTLRQAMHQLTEAAQLLDETARQLEVIVGLISRHVEH